MGVVKPLSWTSENKSSNSSNETKANISKTALNTTHYIDNTKKRTSMIHEIRKETEKRRPLTKKFEEASPRKSPSPAKQPTWQTFKLMDSQTGERRDFKLFMDSEIGLDSEMLTQLQIETRMDDDVETDDEIYDNARKACSRDFLDARNKVETSAIEQIVNNCEIERRVKNPDDYDRNGKFKLQAAHRNNIHPSMAALQLSGPFRSVQQSLGPY